MRIHVVKSKKSAFKVYILWMNLCWQNCTAIVVFLKDENVISEMQINSTSQIALFWLVMPNVNTIINLLDFDWYKVNESFIDLRNEF